jgi:multidrug resistance efflux pump
MLKNPIFREKSFERLISPERLDELLQVTSAKTWLALLALIMMVTCLLLWSFIGSITMTTSGPGIFNPNREEIITFYSGRIDTILVQSGDLVQTGQTLALLEPEASLTRIADYQAELFLSRQNEDSCYDQNREDLENEFREYSIRPDHVVAITSPSDGYISGISTTAGVFVDNRDVIFTLQKWTDSLHPEICFLLTAEDLPGIDTGMAVRVTLSEKGNFGILKGKLTYFSRFPASSSLVSMILSDENDSDQEKKPVFFEARATVDIPSWITIDDVNKKNGMFCQVEIITDTKSPIRFLFKKQIQQSRPE